MFSCFGKGLIGIDIDRDIIRVAETSKIYGGYKLCKFGIDQLPADSLEKGMIKDIKEVSGRLKKLLKKLNIKGSKAAISVCSSNLFIKKVTLRDIAESRIEQIFLYEASHHLPFDIREMTVDYHILDKKGSTYKIIITAIKNEYIENRVGLLESAGLESCVIEPDIFSIINLYNICYKRCDLLLKVCRFKSYIVLPHMKDPYIKYLPFGSFHMKKDENRFCRMVSAELFESAESLTDRVYIFGEKVPSTLISVLKLGLKYVEHFNPFKGVRSPEKFTRYSELTPVALGLSLRKAGDG